MRENIFNATTRRNRDKEILNKIKTTTNSTTTAHTTKQSVISINSKDELYALALSNEKVCISTDVDGIYLYRLKTKLLYYIPNYLITEFSNISVYVISYNTKEVIKYFNLYNINIKYCWDCSIAARVIDENVFDTTLTNLYKVYINEHDSQDIIKVYKLYTYQSAIINKKNIKNKDLYNIYYNIELPCIRVIADIEKNGIQIDTKHLAFLLNKYAENKYIIRYLTKIQECVDSTNYIHSSIHQYAAVTGRMSISNPNLQNTPSIKEIRDIFIPKNNHILISADYSQQEVRILAELSKDQAMIDIFNNDEDIYSKLASLLFNLQYEECLEKNNKEIRAKAKRVLLSIIYGTGYSGLAKQLDCSVEEAKIIKNDVLSIFKSIEPFEKQAVEEAKMLKYTTTIFGRRRHFKNLESSREYRQAVNSKIQGTGADILKLILIKLYSSKELRQLGVKLLLPIHDEVLFECPIQHKNKAKILIQDIMENSLSDDLLVPMKCDIIYLSKWGTEYKEQECV